MSGCLPTTNWREVHFEVVGNTTTVTVLVENNACPIPLQARFRKVFTGKGIVIPNTEDPTTWIANAVPIGPGIADVPALSAGKIVP